MDSLPARSLLALSFGFAAGLLLAERFGHGYGAAAVEFADTVGAMWISAIRMTVIPLVVPLLVAAIARSGDGRAAGKLAGRTIIIFALCVLTIAIVTAVAVPLLFLGRPPDQAAGHHLHNGLTVQGGLDLQDWLRQLIPINPFEAFSKGSMLSIVVFAVAVGFAALHSTDEVRLRIVRAADTLSAVMLVIVQAVLFIAPVGILAVAFVVGSRLGTTAIGALAVFVMAQFGAVTVLIAAMSALTIFVGRINLRTFLDGAAPAVAVALSTSSSIATLPTMVEVARDRWRLPEQVYGFVLPFAVSTFKPTSASSWIIDAWFVASLYGQPLSAPQLAVAAGCAVLLNATLPGIPGAGLIVASPLFSILGLPLEGYAILLALTPIIDRLLTTGNVIADLSLASVIARSERDCASATLPGSSKVRPSAEHEFTSQ